ncbi:MAG: DUF1467 family protein [Alphaproteobacteria bacterium]
MNWVTGLVVYVILWWLVLFTVLPWGNRVPDPEDMEAGQATSAPSNPRILLKMAITTVIAGIAWAGVYWLIASEIISLRPTVAP